MKLSVKEQKQFDAIKRYATVARVAYGFAKSAPNGPAYVGHLRDMERALHNLDVAVDNFDTHNTLPARRFLGDSE